MMESCNKVHLPSKGNLDIHRLVMNHSSRYLPVVKEVIMGQVSPNADPMTFLEIYPVRTQIDSRKIAGISGQKEITTCHRLPAQFSPARQHSYVHAKHFPASADIQAVHHAVNRFCIKRAFQRECSCEIGSGLEEKAVGMAI